MISSDKGTLDSCPISAPRQEDAKGCVPLIYTFGIYLGLQSRTHGAVRCNANYCGTHPMPSSKLERYER